MLPNWRRWLIGNKILLNWWRFAYRQRMGYFWVLATVGFLTCLSATFCNGNGKVSHTFIGNGLQQWRWGLQRQRRRFATATVGFATATMMVGLLLRIGDGGLSHRFINDSWLRQQWDLSVTVASALDDVRWWRRRWSDFVCFWYKSFNVLGVKWFCGVCDIKGYL